MQLFEFNVGDMSTGYYDPARDEYNKAKLTDTRKPRLKLRDLNRLKKMRALQKLERLKREDLLSVMYAAPDDGGMGGPPRFLTKLIDRNYGKATSYHNCEFVAFDIHHQYNAIFDKLDIKTNNFWTTSDEFNDLICGVVICYLYSEKMHFTTLFRAYGGVLLNRRDAEIVSAQSNLLWE